MAGLISVDLAQRRRQSAEDCVDCDELDEFDVAIPGVMDPDLKQYWTYGKGGRLKIRWFTDGSFRRCVRLLRKYFPQNPKGLCANLHKAATGEWPAEKGIPS